MSTKPNSQFRTTARSVAAAVVAALFCLFSVYASLVSVVGPGLVWRSDQIVYVQPSGASPAYEVQGRLGSLVYILSLAPEYLWPLGLPAMGVWLLLACKDLRRIRRRAQGFRFGVLAVLMSSVHRMSSMFYAVAIPCFLVGSVATALKWVCHALQELFGG